MGNRDKRNKRAKLKAKQNRTAKSKGVHKKTPTIPTGPLFGITPEIADKLENAEKPNYEELISQYTGDKVEWDSILLEAHKEYDFGFDYDDLAEILVGMLSREYPETSELCSLKGIAVDELTKKLDEQFSNKFIDMLTIVDAQASAYWNGELDKVLED